MIDVRHPQVESISALKNATKDTHEGNMLNCLRNLGEERGYPLILSLCVCVEFVPRRRRRRRGIDS